MRSIRFRVTAAAVAGTLAVLVLASTVLVLVQRESLVAGIDQALLQRAADVEAAVSSADGYVELAPSPVEGFAQVVSASGGVVAATPNLEGRGPMAAGDVGVDTFSTVSGLPVDDDVFRLLVRPLANGDVVVVATTYDVVAETITTMVRTLLALIPVVTAALAALTWWLVGRTLRPVEEITAEVSSMGHRDLGRRVAEPGSGDEIDRLAATMNQMLDRLERSVDREGRFVADASHELRSPVTRLRAEVELLMARGDPDPELTSLHEEIVAIQSTIEDLLFLARNDAATTTPDMAPVDLDDLVLEATLGHVRVPFDLAGVSAAQIMGNESMLRRAVINLVDNAQRHARSQVVVRLTEDEAWAVLEVGDDGDGVPAAGAETIFDRFSRLDGDRNLGGTGLGLAIARGVADAHGGSLKLLNPGQQGARFEMRLPLNLT